MWTDGNTHSDFREMTDENLEWCAERDIKPVVYMGRIDVIFVDIRHIDKIDYTVAAFKKLKEYGPKAARTGSIDFSLCAPIIIADHKTTGQFKDTFWLNIDTQVSSYAWALADIGFKVEKIIYNQLLKSVPKPPNVNKNGDLSVDKSQSCTPEMFLEALGMTMDDFLGATSDMPPGTGVQKYDDFIEYMLNNPREFIRRVPLSRDRREIAAQGRYIEAEAREMLTPNLPLYPNPGSFVCNYCAFRNPCLVESEGGDPVQTMEFNGFLQHFNPVDY
jgi:PD-(D/E)XK nuclease superfamily